MKDRSPATAVFTRIREILESARANIARSVNTTQVVANWLVGREIVEEEQKGQGRAEYGDELLKSLSRQLNNEYGRGFSVSSLQYMRAFFQTYPALLEKQHALRVESLHPARKEAAATRLVGKTAIPHSLLEEFTSTRRIKSTPTGNAAHSEPWQPGELHSSLSWSHYRTLLRVDKLAARAFYEIEAVDNHWSARELERQINSLLYE